MNQSSKNDIDVYYTSQYARQVEVRMRLNTEIVIESNSKTIIWSHKGATPTIHENYRPKPTDYKSTTYITNKIIKFSESGPDKVAIVTYKGDAWFKLYDTREVIKQQKDIFQRAKEQDTRNKYTQPVKPLTTKQKKARQNFIGEQMRTYG